MISIVTFNLRTTAPVDGINNFPNRLPLIDEVLKRENPDILGFQEMKPEMRTALIDIMPEYTFVGTGRGVKLDDESNCISVRKERFEICATDTVWLSPTPEIPGSRYEKQSGCPRILTWARIYDRNENNFIWAINTHLDHEYREARLEGLRQVLECAQKLKKRNDLPIFITGDFNFTPEDPEYQIIKDSKLNDITSGIGGTFHGYGRVSEHNKIDYILTDRTNGEFEISTWHEYREGLYLSDHDAICAKWK